MPISSWPRIHSNNWTFRLACWIRMWVVRLRARVSYCTLLISCCFCFFLPRFQRALTTCTITTMKPTRRVNSARLAILFSATTSSYSDANTTWKKVCHGVLFVACYVASRHHFELSVCNLDAWETLLFYVKAKQASICRGLKLTSGRDALLACLWQNAAVESCMAWHTRNQPSETTGLLGISMFWPCFWFRFARSRGVAHVSGHNRCYPSVNTSTIRTF